MAEPEAAVTAAPPPPEAGPPAWRRRVLVAARVVILLVIGYFVVATTVSQWGDVRDTFRELSWQTLLASTAFAVLSLGGGLLAWRSVLSDLDHPVPVTDAAEVFLVGQLGKYVPGSVWAYVVQMELGRRVGVPRSRGLLASLVATLLGMTGGVLVGSLGFRALAGAGGLGPTLVYAALALLPVALVCSHPRVLSRLVGVALRLTRREPLARPLSWGGVLRTIGWSLAGYALAGVHMWLLVGGRPADLVTATAAFALAITAGTFAFVAPSGIGVREFTIMATLASAGVPPGRAYALALVSRLLFTVADAGAAGVGAFFALRRVRQSQAAP